jgi:hypothetical protein
MTSLTKPEVSELAVVGGTLDLFCEFLTGYFDGEEHAVGANEPVVFPEAELLFQQSPVTQPSDKAAGAGLDTLAITMVWNDPTRKWRAFENVGGARQEIVQAQASFNFWVRATGQNARAQGKLAADRLNALLNNSGETRALGQKGILRVRAGEPRNVASGDFTLYLVTATAQLRYAVYSQPA